MKKRFIESLILVFSILKWFVLSTIIGVIVGCSTTIFLKLLNLSIKLTNQFSLYFLFLPVAFFISIILTKYIAPDAQGHGTEKVIEAIHKNSGKIKPSVVPIKLVATIITLALGGSAGKEGPCAQIGAGLSSIFADLFKFNDNDRKKLVICGISAGFASVFGTPIAGAIFGVEVLVVGSILYDVLFPSFISGMIAFQVSSALGINYFYHQLNFSPVFTQTFFLKILLSGVFFGLSSFIFIEVLEATKRLSEKIKIWIPLKGILGGLILIGMTFLFSKDYLGLGLSTIENALKGYDIIWYAFILKIIFTSITLNFGGSGGIITPIFFIGATAGSIFANIFHLDKATFAAIGMTSLLAGAANTPIAASVLAVELFGPKVAPYAAISCIISFIMTGHRSVYPSQMIGVKKSIMLNVELGGEMRNIQSQFKPENEIIIKTIIDIVNKIKNRKKSLSN